MQELIEDQSEIATGQQNLRETLDGIKAAWDDMSFGTQQHRDAKDTYVLVGLEGLMQQIQDHQVTMQGCLASRFVAGMRTSVEEWDRRLILVHNVIENCDLCQKRWLHFEFIFTLEEIRRQLPEESKKFLGVDKTFRELTKKAHATPNVLQVWRGLWKAAERPYLTPPPPLSTGSLNLHGEQCPTPTAAHGSHPLRPVCVAIPTSRLESALQIFVV